MKHKITQKLIFFMVATLLVFSITIGIIFAFLFSNSTLEYYKTDLFRRAEVISTNFSEYLTVSSSNSPGHHGGMGMGMNMNTDRGHMMGYRPFLSLIDDIAMSSVWILDPNGTILVESQEENSEALPPSADKVVSKALKGELAFSGDNRGFLGAKSLTVAAPVYDNENTIIGAVLLNSPLEGIDATTKSGLSLLLFSTAIGLILAIGIAVVLSVNFIRPLKKMNITAKRLALGDYTAKTSITQEDEIGDLATTLDFLSGQLDEASKESLRLEKSRQDFISNVSHELRTPVTVLRGSLEALKDQVVTSPEDMKKYHTQMFSEVVHLQRLVDDLLSLTKLQNPDFKMDKQWINLSELLSDVTRSMRQVALKKNITLQLDNPYPSIAFEGDYGRLRQMVMVVLDNAIKFSSNEDKIQIIMSCKEDECQLQIIDQGRGISKEDIPYVFDRFHQGLKESNLSGTGLGLAIAKEIANRHEMKITVDSEEFVQTTFTFIFKI